MSLSEPPRVVVVGAGAAGLAVAAMLKRRRVEPLVLEATDRIAASWRSRYDSLRLNTPRITSTLGGYRIPRRYGRWLLRDDMVAYLEEFARRHELRIQFETTVHRINRAGDPERKAGAHASGARWLLDTSRGEIAAPFAVLAVGQHATPHLPDWPGRNGFAGELLHAVAYKNVEPFMGKDVLVVSARNSGSEIAYELATRGARRVWISMRTPPSVFPREWPRGVPLNYTTVLLDPLPDVVLDQIGFLTQWFIYRNLSKHGIPRAPIGVQTASKKRQVSALIDGGFVRALKAGKLKLVAGVERFEGPEVVLADGSRLRAQVVIAATGYHSNLPEILGDLGVLNDNGLPTLNGKPLRSREHPNAPSLFFNGYYLTAAGQLRFMRIDARRIARTIARQAR